MTARPYFELRPSKIAGTGAFAVRTIRKGTRISEYLGQRITDAEADERYDDDRSKAHHTFLFSVEGGMNIDAAVDGNDARFINHSCDPNCEAIEEDARIFIDAIKNIEPGEELTYDYRFTRAENDPDEEKRYPCHCGAKNCRGTILAPREPKKKTPTAAAKPTSQKTKQRPSKKSAPPASKQGTKPKRARRAS